MTYEVQGKTDLGMLKWDILGEKGREGKGKYV